jgi:IclR family acetate operon transcriptional repressor
VPPTGRPAERRLAAVERALRVLDAFLEIPGDAGTGQLARATGINASTVSRILSTLVDGGFVLHDRTSGRYRLGPHLLTLGHHALRGVDVRAHARPHLAALVAALGETATLSVPGDPDAVTVDFVASPASVASVARVGRPSVAHATAAGKVMLAFGGGPVPRGPLERYTPGTITSARALAREIAAVRRNGHAEAVQEREADLSAVAAPVRGHGGELVAILGVQGPAARFGTAERGAAVEELRRHALALSAALGYSEAS